MTASVATAPSSDSASTTGIVAREDRVEVQPAEARPGEDLLDDHAAGEQARQQEAEQRDQRKQGVAKGVRPEGPPAPRRLGPGPPARSPAAASPRRPTARAARRRRASRTSGRRPAGRGAPAGRRAPPSPEGAASEATPIEGQPARAAPRRGSAGAARPRTTAANRGRRGRHPETRSRRSLGPASGGDAERDRDRQGQQRARARSRAACTGSASRMRAVTGRRSTNDSPRSSRATRPTQDAKRSGSGRSRPYCRRISSAARTETRRPDSAPSAVTGTAGRQVQQQEHEHDDADERRHREGEPPQRVADHGAPRPRPTLQASGPGQTSKSPSGDVSTPSRPPAKRVLLRRVDDEDRRRVVSKDAVEPVVDRDAARPRPRSRRACVHQPVGLGVPVVAAVQPAGRPLRGVPVRVGIRIRVGGARGERGRLEGARVEPLDEARPLERPHARADARARRGRPRRSRRSAGRSCSPRRRGARNRTPAPSRSRVPLPLVSRQPASSSSAAAAFGS